MFKGSTWNIWDFHLHTPYSILNSQFPDAGKDATWEEFVNRTETKAKELGIVTIGVTDYFTIEGYKRLREFQNTGRLQNILLLPNIEFRVDKVIHPRGNVTESRRLNLHVIFSAEVVPTDIEEHFLHNLDFVFEENPFEPGEKQKLKISNLIAFGEKLQTQHPKFKRRSPLETGCLTAIVQSDQIKHLLETDHRFKGKYLLVLSEQDLSLLDWDGQDHAIRKQLIQMSHALFSSNDKSRDFCLGKTHTSVDAYLEEFKSQKPCIWGCDSHGYNERFLEPDLRRFCWIKAEATWEGLKQVLYEPEARVRIQGPDPEHDKSIYTIEEVEIAQTQTNSTLSINGFHTGLNPNLVAIIGGRGIGKTALLDLIASCFQEGGKLVSMASSFFHRVYIGSDPKKRPNSQSISVSLGFKSAEHFLKNVGADESFFDKANIIYLTQNHFDEYSANPEKLHSHIIALVFERFADDRRKYEDIESEIGEFEQAIQTVNLEMEHLRSEVAGQREIEENEKRLKEGEYADYLQRIQGVEQKQGGSSAEILKLTQRLDELKSRQRDIENLLFTLSELANDVSNFKRQYDSSAQKINIALTPFFANAQIKALPSEVVELGKIEEIIAQNRMALEQTSNDTKNSIQVVEGEINELQGIGREIANLQQKVYEIAQEIKDIENEIRDILAKEQRIGELAQERFSKYAAIMSKMVEIRIFLQEVIGKFEVGKDEMLSSLKFSAIIDVGRSREFIETLSEKVDNRSHSMESLRQTFSSILDEMNRLMNGDDPSADFSGATERLGQFAQNLRRKQATAESELYNAVFHRFFGIGLRIAFNNKALSELV